MGIRGLQSYIERSCGDAVWYWVDIGQLAKDARKAAKNDTHNGEFPDKEKGANGNGTQGELVVALDGMACMRKIYQGLDWMCGGQFRDYIERMRSFVGAFEAIGVRPVVFLPCVLQQEKMSTWAKRRQESIDEIKGLFDVLHAGEKPGRDLERDSRFFPCGTPYSLAYMLAHLCNVEVRTCFTDCDREIAAYARGQGAKCLAVFSKDTDFIILDMGCLYLSIEHFVQKTMVAKTYDRYELCKHLGGMEPDHLPLLACLLGNDYVKRDLLVPFHRRICARKDDNQEKPSTSTSGAGRFSQPQRDPYAWEKTPSFSPPFWMVIKAVAEYLSGYEPGVHTQRNLYNIVADVFGNTVDDTEKARLLDAIAASIDAQSDDTGKLAESGSKSTSLGGGAEKGEAGVSANENRNQAGDITRLDAAMQNINLTGDAKDQSAGRETKERVIKCDENENKISTNNGELVWALEEAVRRLGKHEHLNFCYSVLSRRAFEINTCLEDFRYKYILPPTATLFRPLRQYGYWVLLCGGGGGDSESLVSVSERCAHPGTDLQEPENVKAIPIPGERQPRHPGLRYLWSDKSDAANEARWELLASAMQMSADHTRDMRSLPEELVIAVLVLNFIQSKPLANRKRILTEWEIETILAMVIFLRGCATPFAGDDERPPPLQAPIDARAFKIGARDVPIDARGGSIDARAVQIGAIFLRGLLNVSWLNDALGNPIRVEHTKPWLFFDGLWFQNFYAKAKPETKSAPGGNASDDATNKEAADADSGTADDKRTEAEEKSTIEALCGGDRANMELLFKMKSMI